MKSPQPPRLHLVAPLEEVPIALCPEPDEVAAVLRLDPEPWWDRGLFAALKGLRLALVDDPEAAVRAPATPEESARRAVFAVHGELERIVRDFAMRCENGESLRLACEVQTSGAATIDISLRIERTGTTPPPPQRVA